MKRILGLAPNVFLLGLVSLFNDFSAEMIYAVMPAFLTVVLGAPAVAVGLLEGFADALASVLKIFSGWFSDKIGRRKIISVFGYGLSTATRFFLFFVTNFIQVFALRTVDRIGKGFRDSPRDALLTESVERKEIGRSFGYLRAMDQVGGILGPLAAVALLPLLLYDYRRLFLISFFVGILALITFFFVREARSKREIIASNAAGFSFSLKRFDRRFNFFLLAIFVFGLGFMPIPLLLLSAQNLNLAVQTIPLMYFIYSVAFALLAVPFGRISDRWGRRKVLAGGFLAAILAYVILAKADSLPALILGFVVLGLYSAMTDGVGRALTSTLVSAQELATGQGFYQAALGISSLLAGIVGGAIWTYVGPVFAFGYGAAFMTLGLLVFAGLNVKRNRL